MAYDFAETAVSMATTKANGGPATSITFDTLDLDDSVATEDMSNHIRRVTDAPALYARFLLHSLEQVARANLLDMAAHVLAKGGELDLEFRTRQDSATEHLFGEDHFRVYLDPEVVIEDIETLGGKITHFQASQGLAKYKGEDPYVARIVAQWCI
jgi:hypothetical protein